MASGNSPSGTNKYEWMDAMQPRWDRSLNLMDRSFFPGGIDNAQFDIGSFKPYNQARNASLYGDGSSGNPGNANHAAVIANSYNLMQGAKSPLDSMDAASNQVQGTLNGDYLNANPANGMFNFDASAKNQFGGMSNPYFNDVLKSGLSEMGDAYKQGTSAELTRLMNMSGALGGSAHQNAIANNEAALAKQMGNYVSGMQNQQYDRSAGLEDARLGRASGATESRIGRIGSNYENERQRQMGAIGAGQNEQGMAIDRLRASTDAGNLQRDYTQRDLDFNYDQFNQAQNYPFKIMDYITGTYGRAQGGGGMNSTMYGGGPSGSQMGLAGLLALLGS